MIAERSNWKGYLFVAPATVYLAIFSFLPMIIAAYLSVHRWPLLSDHRPFVGLANYAEALSNPFFRRAMLNTLLYTALSVPLGMVSSLAVALLVNRKLRGMAVFRTLYYVPAVSSGVAVSMVWIWIFMPNDGLINWCLKLFGASGQTDFLGEPHLAMLALVVMGTWMGLGPRMVIFLAGLQGVPESLHEAASIDGCGPWNRFRHITMPILAPTTLFVLVTSTISSFQIFTQVYVMTRGGPRRATDVVVYHIFKEAWHKFHAGMASAQSYILLAAILAISLIQFRMMRRQLVDASEGWA